jgi:hypothetical protein
VWRQRELDDEARALRVVVEPAHGSLDLGLAGGRRQLDPHGRHPHVSAVTVLPGNVGMAARVVTDKDRAEPGTDTLRVQRLDAQCELFLDLGGDPLAVDPRRGRHRVLSDQHEAALS